MESVYQLPSNITDQHERRIPLNLGGRTSAEPQFHSFDITSKTSPMYQELMENEMREDQVYQSLTSNSENHSYINPEV